MSQVACPIKESRPVGTKIPTGAVPNHLLDAPVPEGLSPPVIPVPGEGRLIDAPAMPIHTPPLLTQGNENGDDLAQVNEEMMLMVVNPDLEFFNKCIQDRNRSEKRKRLENVYEESEEALHRPVSKTGWNVALMAPPLQNLVNGVKF